MFLPLTLILAAQNPMAISIPDLDVSKMTSGWGTPMKDKSIDGHPLTIGGTHFAARVCTHADSKSSIELDGCAAFFEAWVGVDDEIGTNPEHVDSHLQCDDVAGRDIVFSMCRRSMGDVWTWGDEVGGNCWRTTGNITVSWASMSVVGFSQDGQAKFPGSGHRNELGLRDSVCKVCDLCRQQVLGAKTTGFKVTIRPHGCQVLKAW